MRRSKVVASNETSAHVDGKTWWQWVLLSSTAVYHLIAERRAAAVDSDFLGGATPKSGSPTATPRKPAMAASANCASPTCCATPNSPPVFRKLLLRAVAIGRRRDTLKDTTLARYRADLDRRLDRLLAAAPNVPAGRKLTRGIAKCRGDLFLFVTRRDVPYTNNGCERDLRPSVIFRKVTGGFRSRWGPRLYAAALSIIATGRLHARSALQAIRDTLAGLPILAPPSALG